MSGAYAGHYPHNDNGELVCAGDGEPWPCLSSAERLATGPQPDEGTDAPPDDPKPTAAAQRSHKRR
jgi:hypothetical protein